MKYLEVEGAGRLEAEGQRHLAACWGEEDRSLIQSDRSLISNLRCSMCSSFGAQVWGPMWRPMCSIATLLEAEASSIGCCCWCALFWFCFTWWICCSSFFRLGCNRIYWVLVFYFYYFFYVFDNMWVCYYVGFALYIYFFFFRLGL